MNAKRKMNIKAYDICEMVILEAISFGGVVWDYITQLPKGLSYEIFMGRIYFMCFGFFYNMHHKL